MLKQVKASIVLGLGNSGYSSCEGWKDGRMEGFYCTWAWQLLYPCLQNNERTFYSGRKASIGAWHGSLFPCLQTTEEGKYLLPHHTFICNVRMRVTLLCLPEELFTSHLITIVMFGSYSIFLSLGWGHYQSKGLHETIAEWRPNSSAALIVWETYLA